MKREEILMLVCAFLLGFFLNAILKSSCMGKLYEGLDIHPANQSCHYLVGHYFQDDDHQETDLDTFLPERCNFSDGHNSTIGNSTFGPGS